MLAGYDPSRWHGAQRGGYRTAIIETIHVWFMVVSEPQTSRRTRARGTRLIVRPGGVSAARRLRGSFRAMAMPHPPRVTQLCFVPLSAPADRICARRHRRGPFSEGEGEAMCVQ